MKNRKFYLLDRNIISLLKDSAKGKRQKAKSKELNMLVKLRKIDRKNSYIGSILSTIEGQTGKKESVESIKKTIKDDSSPLSSFFRKARLDGKFLLKEKDYLSEVIAELWENYDSYYNFLEECSDLLYQKVKGEKKHEIRNSILDKANKYKIPLSHHVVICCIATLYGSIDARKVMKPKKLKFKAYNALNDLLFLSRIQQIKATAKNMKIEKFTIYFLSLDVYLMNFYSLINTVDAYLVDGGVHVNASYSEQLFPDLNYNEFIELTEIIKKKEI